MVYTVTEFVLTNRLTSHALQNSTIAARAAEWRRHIATYWSGSECTHDDTDLLGVCRTCGQPTPDSAV